MFKKKNKDRRSRTSPSRSAPVVRYYSSDKGDSPVKRKERIQKDETNSFKSKAGRFMRQLPQRLVFVAIISLLLLNMTLSSTAVKIKEDETPFRSIDTYQQGVDDIFHSSLRNKNKLTLNSRNFEQEIQEKFPEVKQATAIIPLAGREVQVSLGFTEFLLRLTTDRNESGVVGKGGVFVLLEDGEVDTTIEGLPVLILKDQPELTQGTQILTSTESSLVDLLIKEFDGSENYRHLISSITFDVKQREMQVRFRGVPYFARMTPERDVREGVGALVASLRQLYADDTLPKDYIDVRVEGRVFVK